MKKLICLVLACAMLLALVACAKTETPAPVTENTESTTTENTENTEDKEPAGKTNEDYSGTVMLYSSMSEEVLIALKERFEELYPNVTLDYYQAGSGKVETKLTTEMQAGTVACDVTWMADAAAVVTYKQQGYLMAYESPYAATIDAQFKDPDNYFCGARIVLMGFAYCPTAVANVPMNWDDMLKPEYKNQILLTDPSSSGTSKFWLYAVSNNEKYGWDFIQGLKDNGAELDTSTSATHNSVATGAYQFCVGCDFVTYNLIGTGSNLGWQDPAEVVSVCAPIAIPAGCPNEELAKLLYDFILNPEEGQTVISKWNLTPIQNSAPLPHETSMTVDEIIAASMYLSAEDIAATGADMLAKFDAIFKK